MTHDAASPPAAGPNDRAATLAARLIRNLDRIPKERQQRPPLYDTECARLAPGTAASKLGASIDVLAPGKRSCPYHLHHAQEEMFVVLEGRGTLRVAGEMLPIEKGDVDLHPARTRVPAPDPEHLRRSAEVPIGEHPRATGDLRIPRLRQVRRVRQGTRRQAALRRPAPHRRRPRLLGRRALTHSGPRGACRQRRECVRPRARAGEPTPRHAPPGHACA